MLLVSTALELILDEMETMYEDGLINLDSYHTGHAEFRAQMGAIQGDHVAQVELADYWLQRLSAYRSTKRPARFDIPVVLVRGC